MASVQAELDHFGNADDMKIDTDVDSLEGSCDAYDHGDHHLFRFGFH